MLNFKVISFFLVIIGSVSLGLMGLFGIDLVGVIFGTSKVLTNLVYFFIGVSGLYSVKYLGTIK